MTEERAKSDAEKAFVRYAKEYAPVTSGSVEKRRFRATTLNQEYERYKTVLTEQNEEILGASRFYELCYKYHLKTAKYDEFACPYCHDIDIMRSQGMPLTLELEDHIRLKDVAFTSYNSSRDQLPQKGCGQFAMMTMDYARIHTIREMFDEESKALSIFNFLVFFNKSEQHPYDLMSFAPQGPHFLKASFTEFADSLKRKLGLIEKLVIWSDGGLQNYGTIAMVYELSKRLGISIRLNFFAAYHGHNRSDAHFGHIKRIIRKLFPFGGLVHSKYSLDQRSPEQKVADIAAALPNTKVIIKDISPEETKEKYKKWSWQSKGVTSFSGYRFEYSNGDSVLSGYQIVTDDQQTQFYRIYPPTLATKLTNKSAATPSTPAKPKSPKKPATSS